MSRQAARRLYCCPRIAPTSTSWSSPTSSSCTRCACPTSSQISPCSKRASFLSWSAAQAHSSSGLSSTQSQGCIASYSISTSSCYCDRAALCNSSLRAIAQGLARSVLLSPNFSTPLLTLSCSIRPQTPAWCQSLSTTKKCSRAIRFRLSF